MRLLQNPADAAILAALIFPFLSGATGITCKNVVVDKVSFDLGALGGPRSVLHSVGTTAGKLRNTTYTIDLCQPLKRTKKVPAAEECPGGTRVCAIQRLIDGDADIIEEAFPVAGELKGNGGNDMNTKWERLKNSNANADTDKEGLRVQLNGGFKPQEKGKAIPQKTIVEFLCDKDRDGTENLYDPEDKYDTGKDKRDEGDDEGKVDPNGPNSPSLQFIKYSENEDGGLLRLQWRTKYACEDAKGGHDAGNGQHWGFFTWFILIAFLSTATYLIFGSWLNYNRYGARGWDLLPHGDTIRDAPYLLKDWGRRVVSTVQGGGSRGGYAAV